MVKIGDAVTFVDRQGKPRRALVTAVFSSYPGRATEGYPALNVVIVSDDEKRDDSYGRQIEHETSIPHQGNQAAHGYYWQE